MRIFSRKKNESIVIDNDITVTVVEIRGDKVRLAIDAPREGCSLPRQEIQEAIRERSQDETEARASS